MLDVVLDEADDATVWAYAVACNRVVVSKDEDFVHLCSRPRDTGKLVWVRLGNCRNVPLLAAVDRVHDALVNALLSGQRIVELR